MDDDIVKLGSVFRGNLTLPRSRGVRYEITVAGANPGPRVWWAALGVCLGPAAKLKAAHKGDVMAYGLAVYDELTAKGVPDDDILPAAIKAYNLVASSLGPSADEVAAAAGFSEPPTEGSTSRSSTSS